MLFNSFEFLFFLAIVVPAFYGLSRHNTDAAKLFLVGASLFFYGWWTAQYVLLLLASMLFNYLFGLAIRDARRAGKSTTGHLYAGIGGNLALLAYYKYAGFSVQVLNDFTGAAVPVPDIVLPLAISFFTFQQITYLVDASRGRTASYRLLDYLLFVTFFPQLIAGPIVHHAEMLPQFMRRNIGRFRWQNLAVGLTILILGLFKKVILADNLAPYADELFDGADAGQAPGMVQAWLGVLAYTLQIYFDFSGYSDMAVGMARMFGIRLPLNFFSPYKARNIAEFWRRWHVTLSRFLKDYLYIPLGGSRKGVPRRWINLTITMLLGGLWHGASWNFIVWGGLHGMYLAVNHAVRALLQRVRPAGQGGSSLTGRTLGGAVTFLAVAVAWVFFRATSFPGAFRIIEGMLGLNGLGQLTAEAQWLDHGLGLLLIQAFGFGLAYQDFKTIGVAEESVFLLLLFAVIWLFPNTAQIMRMYRPVLDPTGLMKEAPQPKYRWRPRVLYAYILAIATVVIFINMISIENSPFLYFQF